MKLITTILILSTLIFLSCEPLIYPNEEITTDKNWTFMFYLAGDNNLEYSLLRNIEQIKDGYQGGVNVIVFIDRSEKYSINSSTLDENFSGVKLYSIDEKGAQSINYGGLFDDIITDKANGINSADATTLARFIDYSKATFKTKYYALFLGSHGLGVRSTISSLPTNKSVIVSETYNDWIYTSEFTEKLDESHSVDLLGIDACFMGNFEFIYQFRSDNNDFCADYIVASPATEWGNGWNYERIFRRFSNKKTDSVIDELSMITNENKIIHSPYTLTPLKLGQILIDEHYSYTTEKTDDQMLALYDTKNLSNAKLLFDKLFVLLKDSQKELEGIRDGEPLEQDEILFYFNSSYEYEWMNYPYFDIYDFCTKIIESGVFTSQITALARELQNSLRTVIVNSFAGEYFSRFQNNITGLSFFFPDGDRMLDGKRMWESQTWYNRTLAFCSDGAKAENDIVENYFEVLHYWFD